MNFIKIHEKLFFSVITWCIQGRGILKIGDVVIYGTNF